MRGYIQLGMLGLSLEASFAAAAKSVPNWLAILGQCFLAGELT